MEMLLLFLVLMWKDYDSAAASEGEQIRRYCCRDWHTVVLMKVIMGTLHLTVDGTVKMQVFYVKKTAR